MIRLIILLIVTSALPCSAKPDNFARFRVLFRDAKEWSERELNLFPKLNCESAKTQNKQYTGFLKIVKRENHYINVGTAKIDTLKSENGKIIGTTFSIDENPKFYFRSLPGNITVIEATVSSSRALLVQKNKRSLANPARRVLTYLRCSP